MNFDDVLRDTPLGLVSHSGTRGLALKFSSLQFFLLHLCDLLVQKSEVNRSAQPDLTWFKRLLEEYLEDMMPSGRITGNIAALAGRDVARTVAGVTSTVGAVSSSLLYGNTGGRRSRDRDVNMQEQGKIFLCVVVELWIHKYVPVEFQHMSTNSGAVIDRPPPKAVLESVLCVVQHVCSAAYSGQSRELSQNVRVLQRP
eukprot:SAG11_NODE_1620_length_4569_cov_2.059955_5_plen_199_part_00